MSGDRAPVAAVLCCVVGGSCVVGPVDTMDGQDLNHPQMVYSMVHYWVKLIIYSRTKTFGK